MEFPTLPDDFYDSPAGKTHFRYIRVHSDQTACILPGVLIPSAAYTTFARKLCAYNYSVLTIDYFGRSYSEASPEFPHTIDSYVAQFVDLLAYLEIKSCVLISFSFGSLIAANIAERTPSLITHLIFLSPFHFLKSPIGPFQRFVISNSVFGLWFLRLTLQHFITAEIAKQFINIDAHEEAFWGTVGCCLHQTAVNRTFYSSFAKFVREFDEDTQPDQMLKVTQMSVRALVLLGEGDRVINIAESGAWWKRWMPNVRVTVQSGVGHLMFLEKPPDTIKLITQFLHR
jgi:pimeloyl-ACP methyl ester carboxylesterase